jgi:hypothetical protein
MRNDDRKVLTTGQLDGLMISPIKDDAGIRFLDFTVDTLPGLRLVVEADAARELRDALTMILGPGGQESPR